MNHKDRELQYQEWNDTKEDIQRLNNIVDEAIKEVIKDEYKEMDTSKNNGGKTDYYQLKNAPFKINDFDDFAEWRGLNGNQFNMGKVMWTFNVGRHNGTDYVRELNKIIHYANRELLRVSRELNKKISQLKKDNEDYQEWQ